MRMGLPMNLPLTHWWYVDGTNLCIWSQGRPRKAWYDSVESITWNLVSAIIGPTLRTSCMLPMVCFYIPVKPATSMGVPVTRLRGISTTWSVLVRMRFKDAPVSTNALRMWTSLIRAATYKGLLWSRCYTSMSSSVKVMALVVSKKTLLAWASTVRQYVAESEVMDTSASVAAFLASSLNPS